RPFNLTNTADSPASITATLGTPQSTVIGTAFNTPLQAQVLDQFGNPVAGASVTFTAPATGPSGTFVGSNTVLTDANGLATAPDPVANTTAGDFTVTAAVAGAGSTSFALTNTAATGTHLELSVVGSATAGDTVSVTVTVRDAFGNIATGFRGIVRLTSSDLQATLPGDYTFTANDAGQHTFKDNFGVTLRTSGRQSITASFVNASFNDFSSTTGLTLNGVASQAGTVLQLHPTSPAPPGSAFFNDPFSTHTDFQTQFQF